MTTVDSYLDDLAAVLRGPRREKRDLLAEARDHLADATQARVDAGATRHDAEADAVHDFGRVRDVAPSYQAVLSAGQCRRLSMWLLVLVVAQPLAWDLFGTLPVAHGGYDQPSALYTLADSYVEIVGMTAILLSAVVLACARFAFRRLGVREWMLRLVLTGSLVSAGMIILVGTTMLLTSGEVGVLNAAYATAVSWIPMSLLGVACVRAMRAVDLAVPDGADVRAARL